MRTQPEIRVRHQPQVARPGDEVRFEIELTGKTDTAVDVVRARFYGVERVAQVPPRQRLFSEVRGRWGPFALARGERRTIEFAHKLPEGIPPSWKRGRSEIQYALEVEVGVPWWPGRTERFLLPVALLPRAGEHRSATLSSAPAGQRGAEPVLEVSVEDVAVPLGGAVRGSAALDNPRRVRVRELLVSAVAWDAPAGTPAESRLELWRSKPERLGAGEPVPGKSYPFTARVPPDASPGFAGALVELAWSLEVRAVRGALLGGDLVVEAPLDVYSPEAEAEVPTGPIRAHRAAPVGSERRARLWAGVATLAGLGTSPDNETMHGEFGEVSLIVTLELHGGQLELVAVLEWPAAGLDLQLGERRWVDRFRAGNPLGDPEFDQRFGVRARSDAQRSALFSPRVRRALLAFERVAMDDAGAVLVSVGAGDQLQNLESFVVAACDAARAISAELPRVPIPVGLEPLREAWAAYAAALPGRLCPGDFSIRGTYKGAAVELLTRFGPDAAPVATVARVPLGAPLPQPVKPETFSDEARRVLESVGKECPGLSVTPDAVEAALPFPLAEPARAEAVWRALLRVAAAL